MSAVLQEAVKMAKKSIRIIYVKETQADTIPANGIDFNELISTQGKFLGFFGGKTINNVTKSQT